jgi:hypothetical protein
MLEAVWHSIVMEQVAAWQFNMASSASILRSGSADKPA